MSVEPERGSPTTKIGAGSGSPAPAWRSRNACVEHGADPVVDHLGLHRVVVLERAPRAVALGIQLERARVLAAVLERLGERERELRACFLAQALRRELALHRLDFVVREAEGLEVRQAPPGFAVLGTQPSRRGGRPSIASACRPIGLQCVAEADPGRRARRD